MDERPPSRPTTPPPDQDALDETDPHAGDDADWVDVEPAALTPELEPDEPQLFWKGMLIGAVLSAGMWVVLAAAAYALFGLLTG